MLLTLIYFAAKFWAHACLCKKSYIKEIGDDNDFFDWYAAKRGFDLWSKKLKIIPTIGILT
jgi:hypothetical protein